MNSYHYKESGLDNIIIENMPVFHDDRGEEVISIPNINLLHKAIAKGLVTKKAGLNGKELRFLRTEMGMTQAQLAVLMHREPLAIGRWERGENPIEGAAEALIRLHASHTLGLDLDISEIEEISSWCVPGAKNEPIRIDGSDPKNYHPAKAA